MEPEGIWVGGEVGAEFIVEPDQPAPIQLRLRNGEHGNHVVVTSGTWRRELSFLAGEEITVEVPVDVHQFGTPLRVVPAGGFRPIDLDSKSPDDRLLGIWLTIVSDR